MSEIARLSEKELAAIRERAAALTRTDMSYQYIGSVPVLRKDMLALLAEVRALQCDLSAERERVAAYEHERALRLEYAGLSDSDLPGDGQRRTNLRRLLLEAEKAINLLAATEARP